MIINLQGMGDILALTPAIQTLLAEKKYEISLVGLEKNIRILKETKEIKLIPIIFSFGKIFSLAKQLSKEKPDIVFCSYRAEHGALLSALIEAPYICGYLRSRNFSVNKDISYKKNIYFGRDVRERGLNLPKYLGCNNIYTPNEYHINIPEISKQDAEKIIGSKNIRKISIFVDNQRISRSRSSDKRIQLIEKLKEKNQIFIVMQDKGKEIHKKIINHFKDEKNIIPVIDKDIFVIAALLAKIDIFITTDGGPMHVAFAVKCRKVIGLFGPTNPREVRIEKNGYIYLYDKEFTPKWNHNNEPITKRQLNIPLEKVLNNL